MKALHQPAFWGWSVFNPERNLDFHSVLWVRPEGNCAFDPLPLTEHDLAHLQSLGPLSHIFISNSDHLRDGEFLAAQTGARLWGPLAEKATLNCQAWLDEGDEPLPGLQVFALEGSKTPGELAFLIEGQTLITGDLIRSHRAGQLCLLPDAKLSDKAAAQASVSRLADCLQLQAVLTGDGWPVFREGLLVLKQMIAEF
ncbi:MAG: MBL fold metallo-hydrolase [Candidatus Sericytochromatia bacterium]|jgi:hypothetical protein|nr:MBL fold metallo-hydrolase [Candidatus Sericytochromatia bacterium]